MRQAASEAGYPEQTLWVLNHEMELRYALRNTGLHGLAQTATQLAKNLDAVHEILAAMIRSESLACDNDWRAALEVAAGTLREIRERSVARLFEPRVLALIGTAERELGNLVGSRSAAQEGVAFMRESQSLWNPHSYAVLARAQLALAESATDITAILDEYAELLERTGFNLYQGELHELRARLAEREGRKVERATALARAQECYAHFGMTVQAARIAAAIEGAL